jgi:hypothetical protein
MSNYFYSENDQYDISSALEEARDSVTSAIRMVEEFEDAEDQIEEKAAEKAQDFKNDLLDLFKEFTAFQNAMIEWIDDDSDIYAVKQIMSDIRLLIGTSDGRPWTSKYSLAVRVREAIRTLKDARNDEMQTHALSIAPKESAPDTAEY